MESRSIWITGVGTANPLGRTYASFADSLLAGRSGIGPVSVPEDRAKNAYIAGRVGPLPAPADFENGEFARLNPLEQLLLYCSVQALHDSGWWDRRSEIRIAIVLGLGAEWLRVWELDRLAGGDRICRPQQDTACLVRLGAERLELSGPATTVAAACASANYAIAQGRRWVEMGWADACLAGGCDIVTPMALAGFRNLRALSRRVDDPARASRPFERDRDGFVMGEGGAMFLLEPSETARRRNAIPYAEVAGFGATSDAAHMIIPSADPEPSVIAARNALADAKVNPDEVDYLNAHAAGTPVGDRAEAQAIRLLLGEAVAKTPVSSTKSMTGHLLSGAAAVEAAACLVAIDRQAVPPTINLDVPDPECDLTHVPHEARPHNVSIAVSNSNGFGGSNTCLVLRKAA